MVGAALFIVGEMTGSGILGVPCALAHSGYSGFGMMLLCVVVASYTGLTLSRNWMHVRDQYPHCSNPYPSIACYNSGICILGLCDSDPNRRMLCLCTDSCPESSPIHLSGVPYRCHWIQDMRCYHGSCFSHRAHLRYVIWVCQIARPCIYETGSDPFPSLSTRK
eukprot:sb/3472595/